MVSSLTSLAVTLVFLFLFLIKVPYPIGSSDTIDPSIFGLFGDALGGVVGTILAGVSVFLIYKTYRSQRKELRETQDALYDQKNETTFFNLLSTLRQIINEMEGEVNLPNEQTGKSEIFRYKGREYVHKVAEYTRQHFAYEHLDPGLIFNPDTGKLHRFKEETLGDFDEHGNEGVKRIPIDRDSYDVKNTYSEIAMGFSYGFSRYAFNFDHYFRFVLSLIQFIENVEYDADRLRYIDILKAQLSQAEMVILFYAGFLDDKLMVLLDKHKLLDAIANRNSLVDDWHHFHYRETDFKFLSDRESKEKRDCRERQQD